MNTTLRTIKQAAWVGWKVETNWTDPLIFAIYYIVRPLAGLLIIGFVFIIGSFVAGTFSPEYFGYMFVGSSFFVYVIQIAMSMSMLIHEDRAHYEVLRHIYLAPASLRWYILGRALNSIMNATVSLVLTLLFGTIIFQGLMGVQIPINWLTVNYPMLILSVAMGIICLISVGFMLCGINIMTSRIQFVLTEYVSGIFYLFGGVVFTPDILPIWAQTISSALPITYFLKTVRFAVLQPTVNTFTTDLLYLALTMIATVITGLSVFRIAEYRARKDGLIDRKEEY